MAKYGATNRRQRPVPKHGQEWSAHLDQFRDLEGAKRFEMSYDPNDHVTPAQTTTLWAMSLEGAEEIAGIMTREFGLKNVKVKRHANR